MSNPRNTKVLSRTKYLTIQPCANAVESPWFQCRRFKPAKPIRALSSEQGVRPPTPGSPGMGFGSPVGPSEVLIQCGCTSWVVP